jgi:hypothetical protein
MYSSSRLVTLCLSVRSFPPVQEFEWGEVGQGRMGPDVVVGVFPTAQLLVEASHLDGVRLHLVELFVVRTMRAFDVSIEFGRLGRPDEQGDFFLLAGLFKFRSELTPPSTCSAARGNGKRSSSVSRKRAAASEVARPCTSTTSQRETTSRALKCFRITPRRSRSSWVSISTRSPGCSIRQYLGLRTAHGRFRKLRRSRRKTAARGGSSLQIHQNAPHHGGRNDAVLASQQHHQLVLAPTRILLAQSQDVRSEII